MVPVITFRLAVVYGVRTRSTTMGVAPVPDTGIGNRSGNFGYGGQPMTGTINTKSQRPRAKAQSR